MRIRANIVRQARRGAAATELAIVLPFLAVAFGVAVGFCRAYFVTQTLQASAHAGVLYASGATYGSPGTSAEDAAKQAAILEAVSLNPALQAENVDVRFTSTSATVTISYEVPLLTSILGGARSVPVSRSATLNLAPTGP